MSSRPLLQLFVLGVVVAFFVCLTVATLFLPTAVDWDSANGILAAMQYEAGISPDIRTLVRADSENLSRDRAWRITWWPPSYQTVPFAFRSLGMPWRNALRTTIVASFLLGTVGWAFYFRFYVPNWGSAGVLLLIMLCSSYISGFAESYTGGDMLLWAATPFLMVVNLAAFRAERLRTALLLAFTGGCMSAAIYWVKYAGLFLGIGLCSAWAWFAYYDRSKRSKFAGWLLGFAFGATLLVIGGVLGGATPASAAGRTFNPVDALSAAVMWPTAMTDLAEMTVAAMAPFGLPRAWKTETIALTGWLILASLHTLASMRRAFLRERSHLETKDVCIERNEARTVLLFVVAVDTALYAFIVGLGGIVSIEPRLARMSGVLAMPVIFSLLVDCIRLPHRFIRPVAAILMIALFILPSQAGLHKSVKRISRLLSQRDQLVNDQGIRPDIGSLHVGDCIREVRSYVPSHDTIMYTPSPTILFCFPGQRCIFVNTITQPVNDLRRKEYRGLPPKGVALLLPKAHLSDGKLEAIKSSFTEVIAWDSIELHYAPDWTLLLSHTE